MSRGKEQDCLIFSASYGFFPSVASGSIPSKRQKERRWPFPANAFFLSYIRESSENPVAWINRIGDFSIYGQRSGAPAILLRSA